MTLAMTAGALGFGLAALGWLSRLAVATFPLWVATMLLVACATLVLTTGRAGGFGAASGTRPAGRAWRSPRPRPPG